MKVFEETTATKKIKHCTDGKYKKSPVPKLPDLNINQEQASNDILQIPSPSKINVSSTNSSIPMTSLTSNTSASWSHHGILRQALTSFNPVEQEDKDTDQVQVLDDTCNKMVSVSSLPLNVSIPFTTLTPATFISNGTTIPVRVCSSEHQSTSETKVTLPTGCQVISALPAKDDTLTVIYSSIPKLDHLTLPSMSEVKSGIGDQTVIPIKLDTGSEFSQTSSDIVIPVSNDIILTKGEGDINTSTSVWPASTSSPVVLSSCITRSQDTGCYALQSPTEILSQLSKAGVLPTMSSSQVSSVLSALGSDSHMDMDHTEMLPSQLTTEKVSTLTQTDDDSLIVHQVMEHLESVATESKSQHTHGISVRDFLVATDSVNSNSDLKHEAEKKSIKPKKKAKKTENSVMEEVSCFKCKFCPFLSLDKNAMNSHVDESHTDKVPSSRPKLHCPGCSNIFFSSNSLSVHLTQDHQVAEPELQIILDSSTRQEPSKTTEEPVIRQESKSPSPPPPGNSDLLAMFPPLVSFKEEKEKVEEPTAASKKRGRPRGSRNKPMDIAVSKTTNEPYRCGVDNCVVLLQSHDNIEYHRRCHRGSEFACPECKHVHKQWSNMSIHLWRCHMIDMELYSCDQCDYKTNRYGKLVNLHKWIHGTERPFLCDSCGKGFKNRKQLRNHKTTHKPKVSNLTECEVCSRAFNSKRMLRLHMEHVHNKFRPHLCSYCGYSVASVSSLKLHMRKHTGEKPFKCDQCDYCTADHNSLRRHKMQHSGDKPYKCPHCTYACIQSSTFKVHLKTKHPGMDAGLMFSCNLCSFRSVKEENYLAHVAEHKPNPVTRTKQAEEEVRKKRKQNIQLPIIQVHETDMELRVSYLRPDDNSQIPITFSVGTDHITSDVSESSEQITGDINESNNVPEPLELKFKIRKEEDP